MLKFPNALGGNCLNKVLKTAIGLTLEANKILFFLLAERNPIYETIEKTVVHRTEMVVS